MAERNARVMVFLIGATLVAADGTVLSQIIPAGVTVPGADDSVVQRPEGLYAEPALYFYRRCLHIHPGFVNPPGYMSMATLKAGIEGQVSRITNRAGARAEMATLSWKDLVERGYLVAGSPATVADRINDMADKLNVGHLMTLLHFGNMSKETTTYNTKMFAEKVIPRLRSRFSEWDDNWFPREASHAPVQPEPVA